MGAPSKRARRVRRADEIDLVRLAAALRPPKTSLGAHAWDLDSIREARDQQMSGAFRQPSRLAAAMRTDDALFVAYQNRLAPQRGLPVKLCAPSDSAKAKRILDEAEGLYGPQGCGVSVETLANVNGDLANHGVAFAVNVVTPREDGSRIDVEVHYWPIENVRWDATERCFMTQIEAGSGSAADAWYQGFAEVPIVHGDGRWIVFSKEEDKPWQHEAAVLTGLIWAVHAYGWRDWAKGSTSHGNVKWLAELPQGFTLQDADGNQSPEAAAMVQLMSDLANLDTAIGIRPNGSKVDMVANTASAWQIFKELITDSGLAACRIYLGTDGVVGTNPTGPGVDLRAMFGVRNDITEGDLHAIERGLKTGSIDIWCALNFGDSSLAPTREYQLPDADEDARRESLAKRMTAFFDAIERAKALQFDVTPEYVEALAKEYGVKAPAIKVATPNPSVVPVATPAPAAPAPSAPALRRLRQR